MHVTVTLPAAFTFTFQTAWSRLRLRTNQVKTRSSPVLCLGAGVRPSCSSLPSPKARGMARRQGAVPGLLQAMSDGGRTMVRSVAPAPLGAPTRHLPGIGGCQAELHRLGFLRAPPAGRTCVTTNPQVPLPLPASRTPPEGAPRTRNGINPPSTTLRKDQYSFSTGELSYGE